MVRRLLLTLMLALMFVQPLLAQIAPQPSETKPPDVPSFSYVAPLWKTDGTPNTVIDPTVTAPPEGQGLTEVNPTDPTGRILATTRGGATFDGYMSGTTLTVTGNVVGTIANNDVLYIQSSSAAAGTITGGENESVTFVSGTAGGVGTYTIHDSQAAIGSAGTPVHLGTTNTAFCLTTLDNGPCAQAKFRTQSNCTSVLGDDPIRNYGQPGTSHLHQFFGNRATNAYSTYASVRTRNKTDSAGSDLNATGYWFTSPVKKAADTGFGDGLDYAVQCTFIIIYYQEAFPSDAPYDVRIPRGLRYIFGTNMDDPDNSMLQGAAYNLNQIIGGGSTRYKIYDTSGNFNTQGQYLCNGATVSKSMVLVNADGTDPFGGNCNGATFTGSISGSTLTVSALTSGTLQVGEIVYDRTAPSANQLGTITAVVSAWNGVSGSYTLSGAVASGSKAMRANDDFWIAITGASCWDGHNLWSPGGYSHVIKELYNGLDSRFECPYNYYRIPFLHQELHFTQEGFADYSKWRLSADDMAQTKLDSLPICAADFSNAPCANGATFNGHISGTTLTVNSVSVGAMLLTTSLGMAGEAGPNGYQIEGTGITGHPIIESQLTGTAGQAGTYTLGGTFTCSGTCASDGTLRASRYITNGSSIHEDWLFGWDNATIEAWEFNCIGVEHHTSHECNASQISATQHLIGGNVNELGIDGRNPQVNSDTTRYPTNDPANMFAVPASPHGTMTMHTNTH